MPTFFSRQKKVPEELGLGSALGLLATVATVPWVPEGAREALSSITYGDLGKLQQKQKNNEDPLLEELKATSSPNRPLKETLEQAQNAINQFQKNQWQFKGKDGKKVVIADTVSDIASKINQYSAILGPLTQVSPFFPSVVWGTFSMILKIAMDDAEMRSKLIQFINGYMGISELYATYWRLHQHSRGRSSQKVRQIIQQVEEEIRKFVFSARKYYFNSKSAARRIFWSTNVPFSVEFQPICDEINRLTSDFKLAVDAANQEEQKRHEILNWISKVAFQDAHINKARKREQNTCGWLHKKENFLNWKNSSASRVLWVHGNAGFGKTILMSSMVDYLQQTLPNKNPRCEHVAYFYCLHDQKETLDTLVILSSILKQLIASFPDIPGKVISKFEHDKYLGKLGGLHLNTIIEFLIETAQQASSPLFILIDGLDECNEVTRVELLKTLMPLTLDSGPVLSSQIKICLFSRPYDDIREHLANHLEIPILKADNMDDMLTFLSCQITSSASLDALLKKEQGLRSQVIRDLVDKADGMFLWVSLQQMNLCRERDSRSIKHYLQDLPNSENMEESYKRILSLIKDDSPGNRKLAGTVLRWLLCAIRPLLVKEFMDALYFLELIEGVTEEYQRNIVHVCHGLVQVETQNYAEYFRFIHFSAHQFLCNYFEQQFTPTRRVSRGLPDLIPGMERDKQKLDFSRSIHHEMARACMEYILDSGLQKKLLGANEVYNCGQEFDNLATEKPFFLYASYAWMKHFDSVDGVDLSDLCLTLFRTQNLQLSFQIFWFQEFGEKFPRGSTPLHIASFLGLPSIISALLADTSGPFITDNEDRTPIYWAAHHGDYESLKVLGLVINSNQQVLGEALFAAVKGDQVRLVTDLLLWGADPNVFVLGVTNALYYAILKGDSNLPIVQQLIKAGAKLAPEAPTVPPLQVAAMVGALEITQYLLNLDVDINAWSYDPPGLPLRTAVLAGQHEMAEVLLKSGADIVLAGENQLIEMASMMGDSKMIDILLQHSPSHSKCPEAKEGTSPHSLVSIVPETSDPGLTSQKDKASTSHKAILRILLRQGARLAGMGNMSQRTVSTIFSRGRQIIERNFEALDTSFLDALESFVPELGDELVRHKLSPDLIEIMMTILAGMMTHIMPKVQTTEQVGYYERLLKIGAQLFVRLADGDGGGYLREAWMKMEKDLLEAIKTHAQRVDRLFAELEIRLLALVVMERHPWILRTNIRTYLTSILAIIPPEEGIARFSKFLDGVVVSGTSNNRPGNWHRLVIFIEISHYAFAYNYQRLHPQIRLKVGLLRQDVRDNPKLMDKTTMNQLDTIVAGGRRDWQWDADEAPWWHSSE